MAILFDAASSGTSGSTPFTFNHTCASDATILWMQSSPNVSSISYNGVAMTAVANWHPTFGTFAGNCPYILVWALMNPTPGTNTVSVTFTGGGIETAIGASYKGVSGYTYGEESASVGGQEVQWMSTISLGTNDWGISFFGGTQFGHSIIAHTNATLRSSSSQTEITILDSNGHQTPGVYEIWGKLETGTSFFSAVTFSMQAIVTTMDKSETVTVTDTLAKTPGKPFSQVLTLTDSMSRSIGKVASEVLTLTDSFSHIIGVWYQVSYAEAIQLTDSVVTSFVFFITGVENLTIVDAAVTFGKRVRGLLRGKHRDTNTKVGVRRT